MRQKQLNTETSRLYSPRPGNSWFELVDEFQKRCFVRNLAPRRPIDTRCGGNLSWGSPEAFSQELRILWNTRMLRTEMFAKNPTKMCTLSWPDSWHQTCPAGIYTTWCGKSEILTKTSAKCIHSHLESQKKISACNFGKMMNPIFDTGFQVIWRPHLGENCA